MTQQYVRCVIFSPPDNKILDQTKHICHYNVIKSIPNERNGKISRADTSRKVFGNLVRRNCTLSTMPLQHYNRKTKIYITIYRNFIHIAKIDGFSLYLYFYIWHQNVSISCNFANKWPQNFHTKQFIRMLRMMYNNPNQHTHSNI